MYVSQETPSASTVTSRSDDEDQISLTSLTSTATYLVSQDTSSKTSQTSKSSQTSQISHQGTQTPITAVTVPGVAPSDMARDATGDEMNNLLSSNSQKSGAEMWLHSSHPSATRQQSWWGRFIQMEKADMTSLALWQACLAEFVGVFFLCYFTIGMGLSDKGEPGPGLFQVAVGVGFFIFVILSALANVSGAHVNPAVTLAFTVTRQCSIIRTILYIVFQCAGAYAGTLCLKLSVHTGRQGNLGLIVPPSTSSVIQVVVMEMVITGFLDFIVIACLDSGRKDVGGSIPHVVGSTVTANILLAAGVSGGCMNPARAVGPAVVMGDYTHLWMYCVGPCLGGMVGALLYDKAFSVGTSMATFFPCCPDRRGNDGGDAKSRDLRMTEIMS